LTARASALASLTDAIELRSRHARLVRSKREHDVAQSEASRDGALWQLWYTTVSRRERMRPEIDLQHLLDRPRC